MNFLPTNLIYSSLNIYKLINFPNSCFSIKKHKKIASSQLIFSPSPPSNLILSILRQIAPRKSKKDVFSLFQYFIALFLNFANCILLSLLALKKTKTAEGQRKSFDFSCLRRDHWQISTVFRRFLEFHSKSKASSFPWLDEREISKNFLSFQCSLFDIFSVANFTFTFATFHGWMQRKTFLGKFLRDNYSRSNYFCF